MIHTFEIHGTINTETEDDALDVLYITLEDIASVTKIILFKNNLIVSEWDIK